MTDRPLGRQLLYVLLCKDTSLLRLAFALCSLGWAVWIPIDPTFASQHFVADKLMETVWGLWLGLNGLAVLFAVNAVALMYGVLTERYNWLLCVAEGALGTYVWTMMGVTDWYQLHAPGPTIVGAGIALFILLRYPTHYRLGKRLIGGSVRASR